MKYSVQTKCHPSPYITSDPIIAHDFLRWGSRVFEFADNSEYIREVRTREAKAELATKRPTLEEIWAQEAVARDEHDLTVAGIPRHVQRLERASNMLRDFFKAIAAIGQRNPPKRVTILGPILFLNKYAPMPEEPDLNLVTRYARTSCWWYVRNASLPAGSSRGIRLTDSVVISFSPYGFPKWEQVEEALKEVASKSGRVVEGPKRNIQTGRMKVQMWVDVGDCVGGESGEEVVEPPPAYVRDEEEVPSYEEYGRV